MEKLFMSRQSRHFNLLMYLDGSNFPYLYLDLACKQLCFPPRKGINRRNESTKDRVIINIFEYLLYYPVDFLHFIRNCKTQIDFPSEKRILSIFLLSVFSPLRKATLKKKKENFQRLTKRTVKSILGVIWHKTQTLPDHKKTTSLRFPKKLMLK